MSPKITNEMWVELSQLLPRVEKAFRELGEKAHRLEKRATDSRNLFLTGDLDVLIHPEATFIKEDWDLLSHQVAIAETLLRPMLLPGNPVAPNPLMPDATDVFSDTPLGLFPKALKALRWLEKCQDGEPSKLGDEVQWLVPQFQFMFIDDGQHTISYGADGTTTGITRAWLAGRLAFQCRDGRAKAHMWAEKAKAEVAKQERDVAQQARAKAEKARDDAEIRANLNIKGQMSEVLEEKLLPEVKKGTKAAEGAEAEAKIARQGVQRLLVPAEALFKKSAQGIIKWLRRFDRRRKYSDEMKLKVIRRVDENRAAYMPLDVPGVCERVLKEYGYLTDDMPEEKRKRIIGNFQHACELFRRKLKPKQKST